jgi:beta-lactam-binding protein with PASTA domain
MNTIKFFTSKTFVIQLAIAAGIVVVLSFFLMQFLKFRTNHGEEIPVPDLAKMQLEIAEEKLSEAGLELILLDTVDFQSDMPPFSIVEQDPKAGNTVKDGRKIYVKINAGEYNDVNLPVFKDKTYRQILANIKALGLKEGKITYKPHLAKDIVLQVLQDGKNIKEGDKVKKNSTLDFVLGDGKESYNETNFDNEEEITNEAIERIDAE